jgi:beta-lactam-binding protein with PASTA domain
VTVPRLVGLDANAALGRLTAIWPCVSVRAATSTAAYELVVVAQSPRAGTQVPAFGVRVGGGYRPTTMRLTLAAP